ncbi:pectinesterase inhibitor [Punica granatum]|uniref:Pectinesterase inhibitor n=1 Tax=Punica granatum TaxID=22663 RepID=A0A6P8DW64_PUNGR|nr:pectinesterase inhibitor [Punica granatum]
MRSASVLTVALCLLLGILAGPAVAQAPAPSTSTGSAAGTGLVAEVCGQCKNKDLCLSSLNADPNSKGADLSALTLIAIRVAIANATDTVSYIQKELSDTSLEPGVQQALSDCAENYDDAVQQLDDSIAALTIRNYADLRKWVQTAAADADTCSAGARAAGSDNLGLSNRSKTFRQLCNNAITIIGILEKNKQ